MAIFNERKPALFALATSEDIAEDDLWGAVEMNQLLSAEHQRVAKADNVEKAKKKGQKLDKADKVQLAAPEMHRVMHRVFQERMGHR